MQVHVVATNIILALIALTSLAGHASATPQDPSSEDYAGRKGRLLYVSKQGDNSDGSTWAKAFRTIQAALSAVPEAQGGHRIIIRPDTYVEANLYPAHKGAAGAYNVLVGDVDGRLGSGATGRVIIDSGDSAKGFKSYDWWSTMRAYRKGWSPEHRDPTFSSAAWDRWIVRHIYATGSDGGLFWDLVDHAEPFTVVVEDSVGIGRAFGGGVANHRARSDEPVVFRRCKLYCLDWWGDAGAAYVRGCSESMPHHPDAVFENCALVSPDNALQVAYPGFKLCTRVAFIRCRLISLNFSQPVGTPSSGVICCDGDAKCLHVDFDDCTLMGYKIFGKSDPAVNKVRGGGTADIAYTIKGKVRAYVQFEQPVPDGFERLGTWPVEAFDDIAPSLNKSAQ